MEVSEFQKTRNFASSLSFRKKVNLLLLGTIYAHYATTKISQKFRATFEIYMRVFLILQVLIMIRGGNHNHNKVSENLQKKCNF